jgi:hypothetical protein
VYISDVVDDGQDGQEVVVISVPIQGGSGEFVGALAGMFKLGEPTVSSLYASVVRLRLPQTGSTYLVDGNGRLLYDSEGSAIGGTLQDVGLTEALTAGGGAYRTRDADGRDIVAASAPIPNTGWTLVLEDDWDILTASSQRYARILIGLLGSEYCSRWWAWACSEQRHARSWATGGSHLALMRRCPPSRAARMDAGRMSSAGRVYGPQLLRLAHHRGWPADAGVGRDEPGRPRRDHGHVDRPQFAAFGRPAGCLRRKTAAACLILRLPGPGCLRLRRARPDTGYCNAASTLPLLTPDGEPASPPIGKRTRLTYLSHAIEIQPGGQVVLSGADLSEVSGLHGGPFSMERAHELLQTLPEDCDDPSEVFATQLRETLGYPARLKCDFTIIALRRRLSS